MSDQPNPKRSLSEISHLFLSGIREKQSGGSASGRTQRIGPQQRAAKERPQTSVDLTPEEFAQVLGEPEPANDSAPRDLLAPRIAPVSAVIGSHLNGRQFDRVKSYARHLAASGSRIGMIEVDGSEFRIMCFDRSGPGAPTDQPGTESFDPRLMTESIEELNWDIDHWLLMLPNPRTNEAKALLREVNHWILLATCDHDGVVSCYRTLKGLADLHRPRLSLALMDADDQIHASRVYRKISNVCQQFLNWSMEAEGIVLPADNVAEHLVMFCRPVHDKAQLANAPQWQVVQDFLAKAKASASTPAPIGQSMPEAPEPIHQAEAMHSPATHVADLVIPMSATESPQAAQTPESFKMTGAPTTDPNEVIDLPESHTDAATILAAVLKNARAEYVETPIKAPMCTSATLTVSRERKLVMHVASTQGLGDLRSIGQAYRWLTENRSLIAMALPQFAIDAHAMPNLHLLVDYADLSADLLQPLLQSSNVRVQSYRKLRWGGRSGLLLEAA